MSTIVSFHAHPDDEALLTGGTLALASAAGHRVVLVVATRGEEGLAGADDGHGDTLGTARMAELRAAADALGAVRLHWLGYRDSGLDGRVAGGFASVPVEDAARRLADVLTAEQADVLTCYDANGGYGHPDHVQVHRVGLRAAELAGTPRVLQATLPGDLLSAVMRGLRLVRSPLGRAPVRTTRIFSRRRDITHVVHVGPALQAKQQALAAHGSQTRSDDGVRLIDRLLQLPGPLARVVLGREWYVETRPCAR